MTFERKQNMLLRLIITNFLTAAIPSFILLIYTIPDFKEWVKNFLIKKNIYLCAKNLQIPIAICCIIFIPLCVTIIQYLHDSKRRTQTEDMLIKLTTHLDTHISRKTATLFESLSSIKKGKKLPQKTFIEILNPFFQMHGIVSNITTCFKDLFPNTNIIVSILKIDETKKIDYFIFLDGVPSTEVEILNNKDSTAMYSLITQKTVVISNTEKKGVKFLPSTGISIKSIICYPLKEGPKIKYIICVTSDEVNTFIKKDTEKYEYILKQFSNQLLLELCLEQFKEYIK